MENKYQKLIRLIEDNNLSIKAEKLYDSRSGWEGCSYFICDKDVFIFDLSINGYSFTDASVDKAIEVVEDYLAMKGMKTLDSFKTWVDRHAIVYETLE